MSTSAWVENGEEPFKLHPQAHALRMRGRPWWVCCYAFNARYDDNQLLTDPNPWVGNQRVWKILDLKTFKTQADAFAGKSMTRGYVPFSHVHVLILLRYRTERDITYLTQYRTFNLGS